MIKVGFSSVNESLKDFGNDTIKEVSKLLGVSAREITSIDEFGKDSKTFDRLYNKITKMKTKKVVHINHDKPDRISISLYEVDGNQVVLVDQEGNLAIAYKSEDAKELNESMELNEALKPAKVGWYGNSNPKLPDGTPELTGANKAITACVIGDDGKYAVVALMGDDGEHLMQKTAIDDKKEAVKLAERLLKEVKDDMYDPKKVAKKYGMDYFLQESTTPKMNEAVHPFTKEVDKIVNAIDNLEIPMDHADVKHAIAQLNRIKKAAEDAIKSVK